MTKFPGYPQGIAGQFCSGHGNYEEQESTHFLTIVSKEDAVLNLEKNLKQLLWDLFCSKCL